MTAFHRYAACLPGLTPVKAWHLNGYILLMGNCFPSSEADPTPVPSVVAWSRDYPPARAKVRRPSHNSGFSGPDESGHFRPSRFLSPSHMIA